MDYLALILAVIAVLVFVLGGEIGLGTKKVTNIALGLALVTLALVFQFTELTQHTWINR